MYAPRDYRERSWSKPRPLLTLKFTYLRSWVLLEEPLIRQPLKNFPAFHGTRRFNTVFTRALHWSLSWALSIQTTPFHPISLRFILILSTHLRRGLPSGSLSYWLSHQYPISIPLLPISATCPTHLILLDLITLIIWCHRLHGNMFTELSLRNGFYNRIVPSGFGAESIENTALYIVA
jgi:hypothetical protein